MALVWVLDTYPSPTMVAVDPSDGSQSHTTELTNSDTAVLVRGFGLLDGDAVLAWDVPRVLGSGDPAIDFRVVKLANDGTTTPVDTTWDTRPRYVYGGYQRGDYIYVAVAESTAASNYAKRFIRLNASTLVLDGQNTAVTDSTTGALWAMGPTGYGLMTAGDGGSVLWKVNESTLAVDDTLDLEAYLVSEGYDTGGYATAMTTSGDIAWIDFLTYDTVGGDERRVLLRVDASTMTVGSYTEFDAPSFGSELGASSLGLSGSTIYLTANRSSSSRWEIFAFNSSTLATAVATDTVAYPAGISFLNPWGETSVDADGNLYVGVNASSTSALSPAFAYDPAATSGSFTDTGTLTLDGGYYTGITPAVAVATTDALAPNSSDSKTRVYSNLSRNVGSLLESVDAPAVEDAVRMAFFETESLVTGELVPFYEALAPTENRFRFYPYPKESLERLNEYAGGTKLGRMNRAYPRPFVYAATDLPLGTVGYLTPQTLLGELFNAWETEFSWFTYKPVPDLRYRTVALDYTGDAGLVQFDAVVLPQDETNRLSMRDILDRFLALFPGTAIMQDAEGDILLRPTYGPDAETTAGITLTEPDIVRMSTGQADPRGTKNRGRVVTRGGEFTDDAAVMTDLTAAFAPTEDTRTYVVDNLLDGAMQQTNAFEFTPWSTDLVAGDRVTATLKGYIYTIQMGGAGPTGHVLEGSEVVTDLDIPFGDAAEFTVTGRYGEVLGIGGWSLYANVRVRVNENEGIAIECTWTSGPIRGDYFAAVVEVIDITGVGYTEATTSVVGQFGYTQTLVDASGEDVIAASVAEWGERELEVRADAFQVSPSQANELAQALVLHHINPRTVRTVKQSWSTGFAVKPDDVGRLVALPNGETALIESREYSDDYRSPYGPQLGSTFVATVTTQAYETDGFVLDDSGQFLLDDSGAQVQEV